ncbi:hypothetical protein GOODEAATRI_020779 [Goodea atripinnis]|uniref:Uncharacterized protein n=1 Tax=Goodea atripinnis TaxID=208336 RepID=A0ABV0N3C3_9TELE
MAATIDNSNAVQATKKRHLGIPEAVFVVRKAEVFSLPLLCAIELPCFCLLKNQIPQITQTLEILRHMQKKKANVMLEYDIDEAQALLEKNLSTASRNLETLEEDLDYLRDQGTTTEVSILQTCSLTRLSSLPGVRALDSAPDFLSEGGRGSV